ncbi:unnamed protein product, partial [Lasius platythorax]
MSSDLLPFIRNWKVEDLESLSDHRYISFTLSTTRPCPPSRRIKQRRWNLKKFDKNFFGAALSWIGHEQEVEDHNNVTQMIDWLDKIMVEASDVAAPRINPKKPRRQAYWWKESVAELRHSCIYARRLWQRAKKGRRHQETVDELGTTYKLR